MGRQLLFFKNVVFHPRYLFQLLFVLIFLGSAVPGTHSADRAGIYKDGEKIERSGGKRTKEEINIIIQQMRARREAELDEDPVEIWLKQDRTEKYAAQKKFAFSVHDLNKSLRKIVQADFGSQIEVTP